VEEVDTGLVADKDQKEHHLVVGKDPEEVDKDQVRHLVEEVVAGTVLVEVEGTGLEVDIDLEEDNHLAEVDKEVVHQLAVGTAGLEVVEEGIDRGVGIVQEEDKHQGIDQGHWALALAEERLEVGSCQGRMDMWSPQGPWRFQQSKS